MGGREGGQYFVAWLILKKVSIWVAIFFFWHIHYKSRLTVIFDFLGWHIITNWQFGMQMCFYLNYLKFLRVPQIRCSGNVTKNWKLSCIKINRVSLCALFWNWIRNQNGNIHVNIYLLLIIKDRSPSPCVILSFTLSSFQNSFFLSLFAHFKIYICFLFFL